MQTADKTSYHKTKSENAQDQQIHNKEAQLQPEMVNVIAMTFGMW